MALAATVIKVFPKRTEETPPCRQQRLRPLHPAFAQFPSTGCCLAFVCNGNVMAYRIRGNNLWMEIVQRRNLLKWESQPPLPVQRTCRMPYGQEAFDFCPSSQARLRVPIGPRRLSWAAQGTAHFFSTVCWCVENIECWRWPFDTVLGQLLAIWKMFFGLTWACHRCFCWSPNRHRPVTNVSSCCIYLGKKSPPVCRGRGPPISMCFLANRPFLLGDFVSGVAINGSQCFHLGGKFLCNSLP